MVEVISAEQFKKQVFDYTANEEWNFEQETPVILNFFAEWCGPCKMFAPTLDEVSSVHGARLKIYKIDIDKDPEIPELFGIRSVPTTLFLKAGEEPVMVMGAIPRESVDKAVSEVFGIN